MCGTTSDSSNSTSSTTIESLSVSAVEIVGQAGCLSYFSPDMGIFSPTFFGMTMFSKSSFDDRLNVGVVSLRSCSICNAMSSEPKSGVVERFRWPSCAALKQHHGGVCNCSSSGGITNTFGIWNDGDDGGAWR